MGAIVEDGQCGDRLVPVTPVFIRLSTRHGPIRLTAQSGQAALPGDGQWVAWLAVVSQPSRRDIARAQLTTACTWPESSVARHRTDHG